MLNLPRSETVSSSAEFHSAVSQIFNLQRSRKIGNPRKIGRPAGCKPAIQQSETLRYEQDGRLDP